MKPKTPLKLLSLMLLLFSIFPQPAYAYLDLGTGSYIFQMAIGMFVGALFAIKMFWSNIKESIVSIFSKRKKG